MGPTCSQNVDKNQIPLRNKRNYIKEQITKYSFIKWEAVGKGGFGKIWKVQKKGETSEIYAMKEMGKVKIYQKKSVKAINHEMTILSNLRHPFLVNWFYAFQDTDHWYLILEYLPGGDLRYHLSQKITFNEDQINYIHWNGIIHRDLKPENLMFDEKGYLHWTDFGIAKRIYNTSTIIDSSGTPGYMSPEAIMGKKQSYSCDFYALGIIWYELIFGYRPYKGKSRKEIAESMLYKEVNLKPSDIPSDFDVSVGDWINRLWKRKVKDRIGSEEIKEIMGHPWLHSINWEHMLLMEVTPPFRPSTGDNFDSSYANKDENHKISNYDISIRKINSGNLFNNFYFNYWGDKTCQNFIDDDQMHPNTHRGTYKEKEGYNWNYSPKNPNSDVKCYFTPQVTGKPNHIWNQWENNQEIDEFLLEGTEDNTHNNGNNNDQILIMSNNKVNHRSGSSTTATKDSKTGNKKLELLKDRSGWSLNGNKN